MGTVRTVRFVPMVAGFVLAGVGLVQILMESDCVHSNVLTWQTACGPVDTGLDPFACGMALAGLGGVFALVIVPAVERRITAHVRRTGRDAAATVLAVADTGVTINDSPRLCLTLRVEPADGGGAYDATVTTLVPRLAIPRQGDRLRVRVDPTRPDRVALIEEEPATAP